MNIDVECIDNSDVEEITPITTNETKPVASKEVQSVMTAESTTTGGGGGDGGPKILHRKKKTAAVPSKSTENKKNSKVESSDKGTKNAKSVKPKIGSSYGSLDKFAVPGKMEIVSKSESSDEGISFDDENSQNDKNNKKKKKKNQFIDDECEDDEEDEEEDEEESSGEPVDLDFKSMFGSKGKQEISKKKERHQETPQRQQSPLPTKPKSVREYLYCYKVCLLAKNGQKTFHYGHRISHKTRLTFAGIYADIVKQYAMSTPDTVGINLVYVHKTKQKQNTSEGSSDTATTTTTITTTKF